MSEAPRHRFVADIPPAAADRVTITGDEARHGARVKRLRAGEPVQIIDLRGGLASARVIEVSKRGGGFAIELDVLERGVAPVVEPAVDVCSATPKSAALAGMIDQLSQAGATSWRPLASEHASSAPTNVERLERIAAESAKQCGRGWALSVADAGQPIALEDALIGEQGARVIVGGPVAPPITEADVEAGARVRLVIGPEGGFADREREMLEGGVSRGACVVRSFGPHVMRIETAAVVACGTIRALTFGRAAR